ncbi:hypothetical protein [Methylacidimicrobium sp. B4]|nr:hypothetical protein [Methylacidimicrobium sp. B4]
MHRIRNLGNQGGTLLARVKPVSMWLVMKHARRVNNKKAWGEAIC